MTKQEMASYLANLISIMESKEDAGIARGPTLGQEYNRVYNEFREIIGKELADEARSREQRREREPEARADLPSYLTRRG